MPPAAPIRVLLVEDNPGDARLIRVYLAEAGDPGFAVTHADRLGAGLDALAAGGADVVLLDLSLPDAHGTDTVRRTLQAAPEVPIVVLTGLDDESVALDALQHGAEDYLVKGQVDGPLLSRSIRYAIERRRLAGERQRLLERERQARAAAEAAVAGRDHVLGIVSHDLGNSLSAMLVTTRVLLRTLPEDDAPGGVRESVSNIRHLAERMQRLRQDLLDAASLDAGQLSLNVERVTPAEVVEEARGLFAGLAEEKGVMLDGRADPDLPAAAADPSRLQQALGNLLGNAIKFTPEGGRVELAAERVDEGIRFSVRDTGPGIAPDHLPRVFDRFWKQATGNRLGSGLGLAIARGIVEAHGGRIWAESTPGQGSTFHFVLPLAQEVEQDWEGEPPDD
ncbi:MAG TPA: hybrid sensor histidine kinase/response regulator [Longimicrobium sp.]|nr:hybrid sensor histidine kinase/response regulator [Longimicrobium sp.]